MSPKKPQNREHHGNTFHPYKASLVEAKWRTDPKTGGPLPLRLVLEIPHLASMYAFTRHIAGAMQVPIYLEIDHLQLALVDTGTGEVLQ